MSYIITDGFKYISTLGGIHTVYTYKEATKFTELKVQNVFNAMPAHIKKYELHIEEVSDEITASVERKPYKRIERFFSSWSKLNNGLMAFQCEQLGIQYRGIDDPEVQRYWKNLKCFEKHIVFDKYGVANEEDLFKILSVS